MTWSRFDDAARSHPKAVIAGNEAWSLWAAAIMYCNQYGTDGFVSDDALPTVLPNQISRARAKKLADKLCEARLSPSGSGLFSRDEKRLGYVVHDFLAWNPSKAQTDSKREKDRLRKERARQMAESTRTERGQRTESTGADGGHLAESASSPRARARAPAPDPSPAQPSPAQPYPAQPSPAQPSPARELPTVCPLDLEEMFDGYEDISDRLGVPIPVLKAGANEFVSYWTIGAGAGQRKTHWPRWLRKDLMRKHELGKLRQHSGCGPDPNEVFL
jgi:hypothetical protein